MILIRPTGKFVAVSSSVCLHFRLLAAREEVLKHGPETCVIDLGDVGIAGKVAEEMFGHFMGWLNDRRGHVMTVVLISAPLQ